MLQRTAKSCGPDAPTLASSSRSCVGPTGLRQNISADDGGKRARSPGRARYKPLKPLRAGMPGDSGVLVVARVRSTNTKCTRGRGCNGHPAFPTPSMGGRIHAQLGRFASRVRSRMLTRSRMWTRRHSGMVRRTRPGISRFRVRCFASPRNDGYGFTRCLKIESIASIEYERPTLAAVITREGG